MTRFDAYPSPNCGPRRGGALPDMIVIHFTAMASAAAAVARLCDPVSEVSAHYLIDDAGDVQALVPEELRAWHAGAGAWGQTRDVNSHSIGIELANDGATPFAAQQMVALTHLLAGVRGRWNIPPERVIAHSDMAPGRKSDPGPRFDWRALAMAGQSVWYDGLLPPDDTGAETCTFTTFARAFGYSDLAPDLILTAFRLRFRPWAVGGLDATDLAVICTLATRFPVDAGANGA